MLSSTNPLLHHAATSFDRPQKYSKVAKIGGRNSFFNSGYDHIPEVPEEHHTTPEGIGHQHHDSFEDEFVDLTHFKPAAPAQHHHPLNKDSHSAKLFSIEDGKPKGEFATMLESNARYDQKKNLKKT